MREPLGTLSRSVRSSTPRLGPHATGDFQCDARFNTAACGYDAGDCCVGAYDDTSCNDYNDKEVRSRT